RRRFGRVVVFVVEVELTFRIRVFVVVDEAQPHHRRAKYRHAVLTPPGPSGPASVDAKAYLRRSGGIAPGRRGPNTAVPTRTMVAPSPIAASKSPLIPIDSVPRSRPAARSRNAAKHGRGSPSRGGTVISPS